MSTNRVIQISVFVSIGGAFLLLLHYLGVTIIPWTISIGLMMVGHMVYGPFVMYKNLEQSENEKKELMYLEIINLVVALSLSGLMWFFTKEFQIAFWFFLGIAFVDVCTMLLVRVIRYPGKRNWAFAAVLTSIITFFFGAVSLRILADFRWYPSVVPTVYSVIHLFGFIVIILFCLSGYFIYKRFFEKEEEKD
jgi:hypothetical protein